MDFTLNSENFSLKIKLNIFEEDVLLPSNTAMEVAVESDGFCASAAMDIDVKELAKFAADLIRIYETLSGEARIEEPYGAHMYLSFMGDGRGHIGVKGCLQKGSPVGNFQSLAFENEMDQTDLKSFSHELFLACKKYLP